MSEQHPSLFDRALTRRRMLQGTALAGVAAFLAACGTAAQSVAPSVAPSEAPSGAPSSGPSEAPSPSPAASATPKPSPAAELNFANWPLYIDQDSSNPPKSPTLEGFTKKYGTKVNYRETINANEDFFGTIRPALEAGQDTGWDLVVLTDWMAAKIIGLGWVETIDTANTPNFAANESDNLRNQPWDPDNNKRAPWQSGMTGLGFDSKVVGSQTSMAALWTADPRWKGKVWLLNEMRDTIGLTLLKLGKDPATATNADCDAAIAEIKKALDGGIVRSFLGNDYKEGLIKGDLVLGTAWSGDIIQAQLEKASLKFVIPSDGGMIWTDNMLIPKGAAHKYTAELMIDYVYDPTIAAQIAAYVQYVSPVKGSKEAIAKNADKSVAALAQNPLMFPDAATLAKTHIFKALSADEDKYFNDQFSTLQGN
jgi:spermidine/putrescine transport system substrate-binding protein